MKRIILDHFQRWRWVLAAVALAEVALGWLIALGPEYTFEFWAFLLSLWTGAVLLSFDLQRGILRPIALLPISGRCLGRSWWMATVPIPASVFTLLLFAGAAACCLLLPSHSYPVQRLVMGSLLTLVWLGTEFAMIVNAAQGSGKGWRQFLLTSFISWMTILMFFGSMILCQDASKNPVKAAVLLIAGAVLTIAGWLRADQFDPGRAGVYLGRTETVKLRRGDVGQGLAVSRTPLGQNSAPVGYGGVRLLLEATFVRGFLQLAAMLGLALLALRLQGQLLSQPAEVDVLATMGSFMPCWFIVFYRFIPMLRDARHLRTLPMSATRLTVVLLALLLLPLIALGGVLASLAFLALGAKLAIALLNSYVVAMGTAALGASIVVWRGAGKLGYGLLLLGMVVGVVGHLWLNTHLHYLAQPLSLSGPLALLCVLMAFLLIRHALTGCTHAYRLQANPLAGFSMAANR